MVHVYSVVKQLCCNCDVPAAAEIPCRVERNRVSKSSTGWMKVTELGPKLAKKKVKAYMTMKSHLLVATIWVYAAARMIMSMVIEAKPCISIAVLHYIIK